LNAGAAWAVVGFALAESLRRRVFAIVIVLTVLFLALYGVGAHFAFDQTGQLGALSAGRTSERSPGRPCSVWRCSEPCSSARCWPSF
jgi:hypothetical protein